MSAPENLSLAHLRALPQALGDYLFKYRGTVRDTWGLRIFFSLPLSDQFAVLIHIHNQEGKLERLTKNEQETKQTQQIDCASCAPTCKPI